ncbi:YrrS family protein [Guptibacillus hwajinpoensis]|uniref:YrrS family protein n=1 Tax=Guptibacillus hwajinpoensis TaxID=208199 RepID=UPI001CFCF425|nr:YrrS family protein [Pseudalkalibacillus hwajinpoensis]WLR60657.1 YrrS family protein [Pseudalkalibacillus hwajinpoensis]
MRSRYGDRHSKRKQNIVLNSLIGIVLAVILVLVANIVFTGDDSQQTASEEQQTAQTNSNEKSNSTSDDSVTSDEAKDSEDSDSESNNATDKDSTKEESADEEKDQDKDKEDQDKEEQEKEKTDQEPGEPNLEGPWEPVGTTQNAPHTSSYTKGSVDWNEKIKAVESVMGLSEDQMTIWRIGGNGGPQKSFARVSKAGSGNQVYYIELDWIDGEGWKPVSVKAE